MKVTVEFPDGHKQKYHVVRKYKNGKGEVVIYCSYGTFINNVWICDPNVKIINRN